MTGVEWVFAAGMALTSAFGVFYQVKYYKLVDDLIEALTQDNKQEEQ